MDMNWVVVGRHYLTHPTCHAPFQGESGVGKGRGVDPTHTLFTAVVGAEVTGTQVYKGRPERP